MGARHTAARHAADRHRNEHEGPPEPRTPNRPGRPDRTPNRHARPGTSLPQLVGSGLAAAAGMALASELHLYGTTAGAVVFAVAATAGAPLIQLALHRAGDGCAALLQAAGRACRRPGTSTSTSTNTNISISTGPGPGPGSRRALAPVAVGLVLLGALAVTGPSVIAAAQPAGVALDHPPARDPAERGSTDKAPTVRQDGAKSAIFRGS